MLRGDCSSLVQSCQQYRWFLGYISALVRLNLSGVEEKNLRLMNVESPRWYMKKGRYVEAFKSFKRLRNTELQAARDLYYVHRQLMEEYKVTKGITYLSRFIELFTIPR